MQHAFARQLFTALVVMGIISLSLPARIFGADSLPPPDPAFKGKIGKTWKDSTPDFPKPVKAPAGAPNVLIVLLDDVGFGHASTFGGPINTPVLEKLANNGLMYNRFHTTALCSPSRAALLTGRNHHSVDAGTITEFATGFPGYNCIWPKNAACVAEILKGNGYNTAAFGKWHNTPDWQTSALGPFDNWPTGKGFEYFYGFLGGDCNQFCPDLYENTKPVAPPATPEQGYHLTVDLADRAISWIRNQSAINPDKPFFVYFATGANHAPHHAPKEWMDKYSGQFDRGWDLVRQETLGRQKKLGVVPANTKLTERPAEIPAWASLTPNQRRLYSRMQEAYAGYLSHADDQVGRIINAIRRSGRLDNTLILYIVGDNGPSAEGTLQGTLNEAAGACGDSNETVESMLKRYDEIGGPNTYGHYPVGWAWAGSAPFKWTKQIASHFGGTRNPMVVYWPAKIKERGAIRDQFHHVIDVAPTILEAAGIGPPVSVNGIQQKPIEGVSMLYTFQNGNASSKRTTQYFEMFGNRAIYKDGWLAAARHGRLPWQTVGGATGKFYEDQWELYDLSRDFSQADDLASQYPDRVSQLKGAFDAEAARYQVLPLDDRFAERADVSIRAAVAPAPRTSYTYYPGITRVPEGSAPDVKNKSFSISANIENSKNNTDGVIVTCGGKFGGYALYIADDKPAFVYNWGDSERYTIQSQEKLPEGPCNITFDFKYDGGKPGSGGEGLLLVNGKKVAEGRIDKTMKFRYSLDETFDVGQDTGTPAANYQLPFKLAGLVDVSIKTPGPEDRLYVKEQPGKSAKPASSVE